MKLNLFARFSACALAIAALAFTGCESPDDDVDGYISISPSGCNIAAGQSRAFTANGGRDYKWSVSNPSLGYLSASSGTTVRYTATSESGTQTITVTGTAEGIESGMLTVVKDCEATATVNQGGSTAVNISGPSTILPGGAPVVLSVSGGDSEGYKWRLSDGSIGSLNRTSGTSVAYTANPGTSGKVQTITVSSGTDSGTLTIVHQGKDSAMKISGASSAKVGGKPGIYSVSGGNGNYTWSLSNSAIGKLDGTSGNSVSYTAKAGTAGKTQTISVQSGNDRTTIVVIHE